MIRLTLMLGILTNVASPAFSQSPSLQTFVGKNLNELSEPEIAPLLKLLGNHKAEPHLDSYRWSPWYVWATSTTKPKRFLVFQGQCLTSIPGISCARLHLFDAAGKRLKHWDFSTGWRIQLFGASISYSKDVAAHLITIETAPVINGRDVAKQYFGFSEDRLRFLRIEGPNGQVLENNYEHPNHTLGIIPEGKSADDWVNLLQSRNRADVLSALAFLGGRHLDPPREDPEILIEKIEQAKMVKELRGDERIGKLVRQHCNSDVKWIAEAARIAAKSLTDQ